MEDEKQTIAGLKHQIFHNKKMEEERKISDTKYAAIIVQKIVFAMITMILIAVIAKFIDLVVR